MPIALNSVTYGTSTREKKPLQLRHLKHSIQWSRRKHPSCVNYSWLAEQVKQPWDIVALHGKAYFPWMNNIGIGALSNKSSHLKGALIPKGVLIGTRALNQLRHGKEKKTFHVNWKREFSNITPSPRLYRARKQPSSIFDLGLVHLPSTISRYRPRFISSSVVTNRTQHTEVD